MSLWKEGRKANILVQVHILSDVDSNTPETEQTTLPPINKRTNTIAVFVSTYCN